MVISLIAAALVGIVIGIASGLLGIGGGTIMVPAFRLIFDMAATSATATSLFTIIPTSISGVVAHVKNKTCIPRMGIALGIGGACTSPLGVWLADQSPSWAVMGAAALVLLYSASTMLSKALKLVRNQETVSSISSATFHPTRAHILMCLAIGLGAGVISGYVGVGGGFVMIPLMVILLDFPMKLASGTSLIAMIFVASSGTIMQGALGNIDYLIGLVTAAGTIPGAYLGATLVSRVPEHILRFLFAGLLGIAAVLLVLREVTGMI